VPSTFVEVLRERAAQAGDDEAFTFLGDDGAERITYADLDTRARAVAAAIQASGAPHGERALLLYPPGLEYVYALFGCMYAGAIPVPAYPPDPARLNRTVPRLLAILRDAQAGTILTLEAIRANAGELFRQASAGEPATQIATDVRAVGTEDGWRDPDVGAEHLGLLQYTSGSTATPRGVMVSHGNLIRNSEFIERGFGHRRASRAVIWLPPYHDMGLIGGILQPVFGGFPCTLLSPLTFLRRPYKWLKAVSDYRATTSGGPNSAFDMCVQKIAPEQRETLDLSSWEVAFNGAEPVRAETLDSFTATFAPCGFRREAFYPCYGLAEGTLMATGAERPLGPVSRFDADAERLETDDEAVPAAPGARVTTLVGCGGADVDHEVVVVDREALTPLPDGGVGEIWLRGPSVTHGYFGNPEATEEVFGARLADGTGPFLRTGDLGFLRDGELYVTGRAKDLVVVAGRNYYPSDIELAAQTVPGVRRNAGAAFAVRTDGREHVVVVTEVADRDGLDPHGVVEGIRRAVAQSLDLQVQGVALVRPRTMPKTSSGKIQRSVARSEYLDGSLDVVAEWSLDPA
jgi:acyl-CoA synthetase (AMP-forming)/AMP-acid ligase II